MRILIGVIVAAAVAGAVALGFNQYKVGQANARAAAELEKQTQEIAECRERLKSFHSAWAAYRKDHKNAEPGSFGDLIPKYIKDPNQLVCPTAARWQLRAVGQGTVTVGRRQYPLTYGFKFLAAGYPMLVKKQGDKAPMIVCEAHEETVYAAAMQKVARPGAFSEDARHKLAPKVAEVPQLAVLRDGTVVEVMGGTY
jgi:hypothetical protein